MKLKTALLSVIISVISACSTHPVSVALPLPPKPDMPSITDAELACLSNAVYRRLARRDLALVQYQQRLEAIIQSTGKQNNGLRRN